MPSTLGKLCQAAIERDPAARSKLEVLLCYPTVWALWFHGWSHFLWKKNFPIMARILSNFIRFFTGVEIHPGARLAEGVFIDHGMGVVIGETARVAKNVTIYHGVTLGGVSPSVDSSSQKGVVRHPDIREGAIIGSGAQILGDIVVGAHARIGAGAVVTKDVKEGAVMIGIPAREVGNKDQTQGSPQGFAPYGWVVCEQMYQEIGIQDIKTQAKKMRQMEERMIYLEEQYRQVLDMLGQHNEKTNDGKKQMMEENK